MSSARLALLALLYGSMFGVIANVVVAASDEALPFGSFFAIPLLIMAGLFFTFRLALTNAWNVRAATATRKARFDEANAQPIAKE